MSIRGCNKERSSEYGKRRKIKKLLKRLKGSDKKKSVKYKL